MRFYLVDPSNLFTSGSMTGNGGYSAAPAAAETSVRRHIRLDIAEKNEPWKYMIPKALHNLIDQSATAISSLSSAGISSSSKEMLMMKLTPNISPIF